MRTGLDYAGGRPGGGSIRAAGYDFVVRYLSDGGPGLPGKLLEPWEADDLRANGVAIVSNWETTADRMLGGYAAGAYDAQQALDQVLACGGRRDRPIYFSADWDATPEQQGPIDDYLRGAASVIGVENVGIYAGYWPGSRALDNGTATWLWQTDAWSGGNADDRRKIHQRIGTVWVGGVDCDENEALADDFGQWDYQAPAPAPEPAQEVSAVPELNSPDPVVDDIEEQLRGPGQKGWAQLGQNEAGENLTLVDGVAKLLGEVAELRADVAAIKAKAGV